MNKSKTILTFITVLMLSLAFAQNIKAQTASNMQTFFSMNYTNISITVDATNQTSPSENASISLKVYCWALNVSMNNLNLSVYGFKFGQEKVSLKNITFVSAKTLLDFNKTKEFNATVLMPADVWEATYAELHCSYTLEILQESHEEMASFSMTIVKNTYLESLKTQLADLNSTYLQLNSTYTQLNQTYWELQQKYNATAGSVNDLDSTRRAAVVLAITTMIFVASTIYLVIRKPREYL
ncbi:MAG TPA: hypothetical protein VMT26_06540 [Candidatus Bathyarchaeia archaeon]|nr:hypothetical protein [Candidatus Bathyarchaeia archaeon]